MDIEYLRDLENVPYKKGFINIFLNMESMVYNHYMNLASKQEIRILMYCARNLIIFLLHRNRDFRALQYLFNKAPISTIERRPVRLIIDRFCARFPDDEGFTIAKWKSKVPFEKYQDLAKTWTVPEQIELENGVELLEVSSYTIEKDPLLFHTHSKEWDLRSQIPLHVANQLWKVTNKIFAADFDCKPPGYVKLAKISEIRFKKDVLFEKNERHIKNKKIEEKKAAEKRAYIDAMNNPYENGQLKDHHRSSILLSSKKRNRTESFEEVDVSETKPPLKKRKITISSPTLASNLGLLDQEQKSDGPSNMSITISSENEVNLSNADTSNHSEEKASAQNDDGFTMEDSSDLSSDQNSINQAKIRWEELVDEFYRLRSLSTDKDKFLEPEIKFKLAMEADKVFKFFVFNSRSVEDISLSIGISAMKIYKLDDEPDFRDKYNEIVELLIKEGFFDLSRNKIKRLEWVDLGRLEKIRRTKENLDNCLGLNLPHTPAKWRKRGRTPPLQPANPEDPNQPDSSSQNGSTNRNNNNQSSQSQRIRTQQQSPFDITRNNFNIYQNGDRGNSKSRSRSRGYSSESNLRAINQAKQQKRIVDNASDSFNTVDLDGYEETDPNNLHLRLKKSIQRTPTKMKKEISSISSTEVKKIINSNRIGHHLLPEYYVDYVVQKDIVRLAARSSATDPVDEHSAVLFKIANALSEDALSGFRGMKNYSLCVCVCFKFVL